MKIIMRKWSDLKSSEAAKMLAGKFPDCGVRYTTRYGEGLVLVNHNVTDINLVRMKAIAAGVDSLKSHVFIIPRKIAASRGI